MDGELGNLNHDIGELLPFLHTTYLSLADLNRLPLCLR